MKLKNIIPLLMVAITSCTQNTFVISRKVFCFSVMADVFLYEGKENNLLDIDDILTEYSNLSDNYESYTGINNVYSINQTNDEVVVDSKLFDLLKKSFELMSNATNFNPLLGSLSKKWKEATANNTTLSNEVINQELEKINATSFSFDEDNLSVQRTGEAELDLGAVAKGYSLDIVKGYLSEQNIKHYLINAGNSSLLLGEKTSDNGYFSVGIKDLNNVYFTAKNCVISTSGNTEQGKHIVNPFTGQLADQYDMVVVVSEDASLGDALSTSMMMSSIDEIKELETSLNVKAIVIKNGSILYENSGLGVKRR